MGGSPILYEKFGGVSKNAQKIWGGSVKMRKKIGGVSKNAQKNWGGRRFCAVENPEISTPQWYLMNPPLHERTCYIGHFCFFCNRVGGHRFFTTFDGGLKVIASAHVWAK